MTDTSFGGTIVGSRLNESPLDVNTERIGSKSRAARNSTAEENGKRRDVAAVTYAARFPVLLRAANGNNGREPIIAEHRYSVRYILNKKFNDAPSPLKY